jgi:DNA-binding NarL/FixJ family response regulator
MDEHFLVGENYQGANKSLREWPALSFPPYQLWEAATGEEAMTMAQAASSCQVVMDIGLPGRSGLGATYTIKESVGSTQAVRRTIHEDDDHWNHAGADAASAYVAQGAVKTELWLAVRRGLGKQNGVVAHG